MGMKWIGSAGIALLLALVMTSGGLRGQTGQTHEAHATAWMDLAKTPPMGWNSWNKFGCNVSEQLIRETADAMVSTGMKDAGYQYIVIDDCWQMARDDHGNIVPDPKRFPLGMKALADYVHSKGLKFGLYSDAGSKTCEGRPGSSGYEIEDARQYAAWGIDYLKYDWCHAEGVDPKIAYPTMRDALKATGRSIVFSLCEWGKSTPWTWARGVGHLWRSTEDIQDCYDCLRDWGGAGWVRILDQQVGLEKFAGPGGWNDPDMLEVGNGGLSAAESRAHFSFWCLLAAPLMAGNDLRSMSTDTRNILTNKEVISIDQDPLGIEGHRIRKDGDIEVWEKEISGNGHAVILFNRGRTGRTIPISWYEIGIKPDSEPTVRDLWTGKDLGKVKGMFAAQVAPHDVVLIRVTP
ncbi:MAG TPA: alpha-galactosidase [Acidobacteriota bacterium]|nr:alpha-galactosidase [Acidobacteriota bacterium]